MSDSWARSRIMVGGVGGIDQGADDDSWQIVPDPEDDPRFDRHGFRRHAEVLERTLEFEASYAAALARQEQRWSRLTPDGKLASPGVREFKRLARRGVPAELRKTVWPRALGADMLQAAAPAGHFDGLVAEADARLAPELKRQIEIDLPRTFPSHLVLSTAEAQDGLRRVLWAYAQRTPSVGYVQGMGTIAALLLIVGMPPELAFWSMVAVLEHRLPPRYFDSTLLGVSHAMRWS